MDAVEVDPTTTSAQCNRILHQPGSSAVGLNLKAKKTNHRHVSTCETYQIIQWLQ